MKITRTQALPLAAAALALGLMAMPEPAQAGPSSWFSSSISRLKSDFSCFCNSRSARNQYVTIRHKGRKMRVRVTDSRAPTTSYNNYGSYGDNRGYRTQAQQQRWDK